jgi:hypothetical protein
MSNSPYADLPPSRFWRTGVSEQSPQTINDIYRKKFEIAPTDRIATAGSCFAQHISRQMKRRGYRVLDVEPPPPGLHGAEATRYGYDLYSARYGNVYHIRQMLQLALEATGARQPADCIWEKDGRYYDAMRPSVEPDGLDSPEEVALLRANHLRRVEELLRTVDIFVFTFGLTEAWIHRESATVYPVAPGTIAGAFDPSVHAFKNFGFAEVYADFLDFRALLKSFNPEIRFLVTVSPVPLTATACPEHVLPATTYSKSVLRAVAGQLFQDLEDVDYFPSYELIATPFSRGAFFHDNLRSVTDEGVANAMRVFFSEHSSAALLPADPHALITSAEELVCEEILLEAFGQ